MQEIILVLTTQHGRLDHNEVAQTGGLTERHSYMPSSFKPWANQCIVYTSDQVAQAILTASWHTFEHIPEYGAQILLFTIQLCFLLCL